MKIAPLLAALTLALALSAHAVPALAGAPTRPAEAAPVQAGLPIAVVTQWLADQGLRVGAVEGEPQAPRVRVSGDDLEWTLNFNGCREEVCGDLQFGAGFRNPSATQARVNEWNARSRFLKSFHVAPDQPGGEGTGMVQYDVLILPGLGVEQLTDALAIWRGLLPAYAVHIGYFVQERPAAPAPQ